jgi:hypothetical protein
MLAFDDLIYYHLWGINKNGTLNINFNSGNQKIDGIP